MKMRIIELETKISYQDHTIDELNDVIVQQQQQIDQINLQLKRLHAQLTHLRSSSSEINADDTPPPHY